MRDCSSAWCGLVGRSVLHSVCAMAIERLGFLGGSFDPVHWGHLVLARDAMEQAGLDRVSMVPVSRNPLKDEGPLAPAADRLAMLRAACALCPGLDVLAWELDREGPSYTIVTVERLRAAHPGAVLHWIIGEDQLPSLHLWHRIGELARMVTFLVLTRPRSSGLSSPVEGLRLEFLRRREVDISSTEIRKRLAAGLPIGHMVPPEVSRHIEQHSLYTFL